MIRYAHPTSDIPGKPYAVQGLACVGSALEVSIAYGTVYNGTDRKRQPASGLPYPPDGTPCVNLILWRPSGEIVSGGYMSMTAEDARGLAAALLVAAERIEA